MDTKYLLLQEIEQTPEPILDEVLDFLRFLKAKQDREELENKADLEAARNALDEAKQYGTTSLASNHRRQFRLESPPHLHKLIYLRDFPR